MPKVVINTCYGGFGLSQMGRLAYEKNSGMTHQGIDRDSPAFRACPHLVRVVEEMGTLADTHVSKLAIVEVPEGVEWEIAEYDGFEWVAEKHRRWGAGPV